MTAYDTKRLAPAVHRYLPAGASEWGSKRSVTRYPTLIDLPDELTGERVYLRSLRSDDGPAMLAAIEESRTELDPWLTWPKDFQTEDHARDYCIRMAADWLRRSQLVFGIFARTTDTYLGGTGLHQINWNIPAFEIGYWLRTSATGNGYMTEAVSLLTVFAFEQLGARRVKINSDVENKTSRAIPERLGYLLEGTLRNDSVAPSGEVRSTAVYALTDDDYRNLKSAQQGRS